MGEMTDSRLGVSKEDEDTGPPLGTTNEGSPGCPAGRGWRQTSDAAGKALWLPASHSHRWDPTVPGGWWGGGLRPPPLPWPAWPGLEATREAGTKAAPVPSAPPGGCDRSHVPPPVGWMTASVEHKVDPPSARTRAGRLPSQTVNAASARGQPGSSEPASLVFMTFISRASSTERVGCVISSEGPPSQGASVHSE